MIFVIKSDVFTQEKYPLRIFRVRISGQFWVEDCMLCLSRAILILPCGCMWGVAWGAGERFPELWNAVSQVLLRHDP